MTRTHTQKNSVFFAKLDSIDCSMGHMRGSDLRPVNTSVQHACNLESPSVAEGGRIPYGNVSHSVHSSNSKIQSSTDLAGALRSSSHCLVQPGCRGLTVS